VPGTGQKIPVRELLGDQALDALLAQSRDAAGGLRLTGEGSLLGELVKAVPVRALEAELTAHLGYARHERSGSGAAGNARNGVIRKTVQTGSGRCAWRCRGTGPGPLSRCWCPSGPAGSPVAWTT
jgi:hypothetical protein